MQPLSPSSSRGEGAKVADVFNKSIVIVEAKQLLRNKKYTVLQVSEMLNFTSQSLFGRYFKKFTGQSPKEYQNI